MVVVIWMFPSDGRWVWFLDTVELKNDYVLGFIIYETFTVRLGWMGNIYCNSGGIHGERTVTASTWKHAQTYRIGSGSKYLPQKITGQGPFR